MGDKNADDDATTEKSSDQSKSEKPKKESFMPPPPKSVCIFLMFFVRVPTIACVCTRLKPKGENSAGAMLPPPPKVETKKVGWHGKESNKSDAHKTPEVLRSLGSYVDFDTAC